MCIIKVVVFKTKKIIKLTHNIFMHCIVDAWLLAQTETMQANEQATMRRCPYKWFQRLYSFNNFSKHNASKLMSSLYKDALSI